jgi:breast cancer 2 susceptibility protein
MARYERELNRGKRPALRLIAARDAPAALPMILCVSDIFWSESKDAGDSNRVPELEMSDGWYRLRATVDPTLARAISRGLIRIGRKIGIAGAQVSIIMLSAFVQLL